MNNDTVNKQIMIAVFWGSLWGIAEATGGYMAHMMSANLPGIAGFIMFPIGFYCMNKTLKASGKTWTIFAAASIASGIKLMDLFLPGISPIHTINPAVSILLEALAVISAVTLSHGRQKISERFRFSQVLIASTTWRVGFVIYSIILFILSISTEFFRKETITILRFLLLEPVINAAIIMAFLKIKNPFSFSSFRIGPALAAGTLTAAILLKFLLTSLY
jgi:hypothetical protein